MRKPKREGYCSHCKLEKTRKIVKRNHYDRWFNDHESEEEEQWYLHVIEAQNILGKVHVYRSGDNSVVPSIRPITPIVRRPTFDIIHHAAEETNTPPLGRRRLRRR